MAITSDVGRPAGARSFWLGFAAYLLPTFPIAFVWHLVLFEQKYHALHIYRDEPVIAFGLASMVIQGAIFSWLFPRVFTQRGGSFLKEGLLYGLGAGLLSWDTPTRLRLGVALPVHNGATLGAKSLTAYFTTGLSF